MLLKKEVINSGAQVLYGIGPGIHNGWFINNESVQANFKTILIFMSLRLVP